MKKQIGGIKNKKTSLMLVFIGKEKGEGDLGCFLFRQD